MHVRLHYITRHITLRDTSHYMTHHFTWHIALHDTSHHCIALYLVQLHCVTNGVWLCRLLTRRGCAMNSFVRSLERPPITAKRKRKTEGGGGDEGGGRASSRRKWRLLRDVSVKRWKDNVPICSLTWILSTQENQSSPAQVRMSKQKEARTLNVRIEACMHTCFYVEPSTHYECFLAFVKKACCMRANI